MSGGSEFFDGIEQHDLSAAGISLKAPGFYPDVRMMLAVLTANADVARNMLPSGRFRTLSLVPGRAMVGVNCFEYRDTPVGPYNEVSIAIGIQVDRTWAPRSLSVARATLKQDFHAYVHQLPVNTEIAWRAGVEIFQYPKFLASIEFEDGERTRRCVVSDRDTGALIFAFEGGRIETWTRRNDVATFHSYPIIDGAPAHARMRINQLEKGSRMLGGHFEIEIGQHEQSEPLRHLAPGRLLQYSYVPRAEAILYEPVPI